ncbi:MAG: WYL domain-containing protein [Lachnospiraceae bacterium]|nr:WYL domain-containing protein [Lachnospiraceae bacterium]
MEKREHKADRLLEIFLLAMKGERLSVKELSQRFQCSTRSITRDINEIKSFLAEHRDTIGHVELVYSSVSHRYQLEIESFLTNKELLGIAKVLIGSRAFSTQVLVEVMEKLKQYTSPNDREKLEHLIRKEIYHYAPVHADCEDVLEYLWKITDYIEQKRFVTIDYYKMDRTRVSYRIKPMAIMFTEYYFYLIAYKDNDDGIPYHFRLDRIIRITAHRDYFEYDRRELVDEGIIRNESQFMFPGKARHVRFSFSGPSVQAVLDRMPTAKIVERKDGKYIIDAEVFGDGLKMFLLSQGSWVEVLSPQEFREEMAEEIERMSESYR